MIGKLVLALISHPNSNTVPFSKIVVVFKIEPFWNNVLSGNTEFCVNKNPFGIIVPSDILPLNSVPFTITVPYGKNNFSGKIVPSPKITVDIVVL